MKLSRKERKEVSNIKRDKYQVMIIDEASRLTKPEPLDKNWIIKLDDFLRGLIKDNPLDAHLIRSAGYKFQRNFLKSLEEVDRG